MRHDAARLTRDAAPCGGTKAKRVDVFIKGFHAHGLSHRHKGGVAGILHHLEQGLLAMAARLPAAYLLAVDDVVSRAINAEAFIDGVTVKRRSKRDKLECGARLIRIGHNAVSCDRREKLRVFAGRVIRIIIRLRGNCEDRAGLAIHQDALRRRCVIDLESLLARLLKRRLVDAVHRQNEVVTIHRFDDFLHAVGERVALAVGFRNHASVLAGKVFVIFLLEPRLSHAIHGRETQQLGKQGARRIIPLCVNRSADAHTELTGCDLVNHLAFHAAGEDDLLLLCVADFGEHGFIFQPQKFRKLRCYARALHCINAVRPNHDLVSRTALGKHHARRIQNTAARRRQGSVARPLRKRPLLQFIALNNLNIEQPADEHHEYGGDYAQGRKQSFLVRNAGCSHVFSSKGREHLSPYSCPHPDLCSRPDFGWAPHPYRHHSSDSCRPFHAHAQSALPWDIPTRPQAPLRAPQCSARCSAVR